MNNDKKQQARDLFFQTDLTKTQIADMLCISRRSLTYWIREGNWNRLKNAATHMPSILAENCYHIIGHLTEYYLSERRMTNPVTIKEAETLHKLAATVNKLKNRAPINESMEIFGFFMDGLRKRNAPLADEISPYINDYIAARAGIYRSDVMPEHFTPTGRIPWVEEDKTEQRIDNAEAFYSDPDIIETYAQSGIPIPGEEKIQELAKAPAQPYPRYTLNDRNRDRLEDYQKWQEQKEEDQLTKPSEEIYEPTHTHPLDPLYHPE